jgi:hypothetical protein
MAPFPFPQRGKALDSNTTFQLHRSEISVAPGFNPEGEKK